MKRQTAVQGMIFSACIFIACFIAVCSSGCVTQRGAKEMRVIVPAIFEWRIEYWENDGSEITIGSTRAEPTDDAEDDDDDGLALPKFLDR